MNNQVPVDVSKRWSARVVDRIWRDAAVSGDHGKLAQLLADGADINHRDRHGQTALMIAALHGQTKAVEVLIDHGANLDVTAKYSLSALMLAVINRHEAVARRLVGAGADVRIAGSGPPGFTHKTAYDLALEYGLPDVAVEIEKRQRGLR